MDNDTQIEHVTCDYCEAQCDCTTEFINKQYSKFGGFFCSLDCKNDYVYAEFNHMLQSNGMTV